MANGARGGGGGTRRVARSTSSCVEGLRSKASSAGWGRGPRGRGPDEAYGQRREQLAGRAPSENMTLDAPPHEGMSLLMQMENGEQIPVTVVEVTDTHVTLDANHPLAGRKLTFDLKLVSAGAEEKGAG